ncbi:MAG TPA: cytochrome P450 [Streptosporangiaceae bacterium]
MSVRTDTVLPPGPGDCDLRAMRNDPLRFLSETTATYGDIVRYEAGDETIYLLNRPELARQVLKDNAANYTKDRTPDHIMLRPLLGNGLLTSEGDDWDRQRHMCAPAFRRSQVEKFGSVMTSAAQSLLERWRPAIASGSPVRVDHDLTALTLMVVIEAMFGADVAGIGEGFGRAVDAVNSFIGHYLPTDGVDQADTGTTRARYARAAAFLDQVVRAIVVARRAGGGAGRMDLLADLLASPAEVSDTELRDQVLTIAMAGHETTAKSLTWTLYLLDQHPRVAEQVTSEVDAALGGRLPTAADLPRLPMCRQVIEEALRLYPPVWQISRRAIGPDRVDGFDVTPGALVGISPYLLHRHPAYWAEPDAFRPERFAAAAGGPGQLSGAAAERPSHLYLPFGGGPRICIGQHFAIVEATLVLATLVREVRLEVVPGFVVEPEALVTLRPRNGLLAIPRPR